MEEKVRTDIYVHSEQLPADLMEDNFFHSTALFRLLEQTPRQWPRMAVARNADGQLLGQLLVCIRQRTSWLPPFLYRHCRIYGEGVYPTPREGSPTREEIFGILLQAVTRQLGHSVGYVEVSHLSQKMFAYRQFRQNAFFPVRWMSIHNSLHSRTPEERISRQLQQTIDHAYNKGVETIEAESEGDLKAFARLLKKHNMLKPKRYIPREDFFARLRLTGHGRLFLTRYHDHIIGCSACAYSNNNAYLWYAAYRRKSFAWLHPAELTIWHAIKDAHRRGYDHIYFMDVGLPYRRNPLRDFILSFGGKPASTYRWFHSPVGWLNRLLSWFYRD